MLVGWLVCIAAVSEISIKLQKLFDLIVISNQTFQILKTLQCLIIEHGESECVVIRV